MNDNELLNLLKNLIDYASKSSLYTYDNENIWFLLKDKEFLPEFALALIKKDTNKISEYFLNDKVMIFNTIKQIDIEHFYCINLQNTYLLAPYRVKK